MYSIEIGRSALKEIARVPAYYGKIILEAIERQLGRDPARETRRRKPLPEIEVPFEAVPPIWELRVGEYRVFYDVSVEQRMVFVRAVRRKPPHRTTKEIL